MKHGLCIMEEQKNDATNHLELGRFLEESHTGDES